MAEEVHVVQQTQDRIRDLLRAYASVTCGVDHDDVLRHVLTAAMDLVGARYGALGITEAGQLVDFRHAGVPHEAAHRIGGPPEGKGVLGALIDDPRFADVVSRYGEAIARMQAHPVLMDYMPFTPQTRQRLDTLARLEPRLLAAMHGSAYEGDGAAALRAAGDVMERQLGSTAVTTHR